MAKLPEAERPPVEVVERFLQVSPNLRAKFGVDLQNDCACATELYEAGGNVFGTCYWDNGPRLAPSHLGYRLVLPIHPGVLTDAIVQELLDFAGCTEEVFEQYDMLHYGTITANLAGWGILCFGPRRKDATTCGVDAGL
jgi:hypothetical protein